MSKQSGFTVTEFKIKAEKPNFAQNEEEILAYWNKIDALEMQLEHTKNLPEYTFYDGPPFATGLPHYGHICAGTIKDVVTRYASMNGFHVKRRFGWDCHGLPIEFQIDKELKITHRKQILDIGIDKYNEKCQSIVMKYSAQWKDIVNRLGRWIDFDNSYKTMDCSFMQSVWWVFKQIFEKGLVYRGCKIMPYSNGCMTVLSNFEAQQNYQDVSDLAAVVSFPLLEDKSVSFLAWTTTPWTLPSNLALSLNPNFKYVMIQETSTEKKFILAKCRLVELYKSASVFSNCESKDYKEPLSQPDFKEFKILKEYQGKELEGKEYEPLFSYYYEEMKPKGCFKVLCGTFVTSDSGTGIVHTSPAFGTDDYQICKDNNVIDPDNPCVSVDDNGLFIERITEYQGKYIKECDKEIVNDLKKQGKVYKSGNYVHSYPMCWRSDTPLIYKAVHCWFIKVTDLKERLLANNLKSKWIPEFAQHQRFQKWLENVNDWCFSRNRYWGNPIPLWVSDDYEEVVCIQSIEELIEKAQLPKDTIITDLHMHNIDHIQIPSKMGKGMLKRIPETFDCWFESGSMPYASKGVPVEMSLEEFQKVFPADFIGEGIDQTRGWFYTLNVIGTALYDTCPYKNLIVNGIVKAADGKKLSKSKKNFTDPMIIVNQYGADALRLYLMNSPLVKGQDLKFKDDGVVALIKDIFLPWYQLIRLLNQEINRYEIKTNTNFVFNHELFRNDSQLECSNTFDQWILAKTQEIVSFVHIEFANYRLYTVLKKQLQFLYELSNWYVNMNKNRFRGINGPQDTYTALNVFYYSFLTCIISMAPYVPFIVEYFYQDMKKVMRDDCEFKQESIHLLRIPQPIQHFQNENLVETVLIFQKLISQIRKEREFNKISKKQPLKVLRINPKNDQIRQSIEIMSDFIKEHANVMEIQFAENFKNYVKITLKPNIEKLKEGLDDKSKFSQIFPLIKNLSESNIDHFIKNKSLRIDYEYKGQKENIELDEDCLMVSIEITQKSNDQWIVAGDEDFVFELNKEIDEDLKRSYLAREITN